MNCLAAQDRAQGAQHPPDEFGGEPPGARRSSAGDHPGPFSVTLGALKFSQSVRSQNRREAQTNFKEQMEINDGCFLGPVMNPLSSFMCASWGPLGALCAPLGESLGTRALLELPGSPLWRKAPFFGSSSFSGAPRGPVSAASWAVLDGS